MTAGPPALLLEDGPWDFDGEGPFPTEAAFAAAHARYLADSTEDDPPEWAGWDPTAFVLACPRFLLEYYADPPDEPAEYHRTLISSDSPSGFTAGELLFKVHNAVVERLSHAGHHWFEGLSLKEGLADELPRYQLIGGS